MAYYRKYLEPGYGDVAPEVHIMEPQKMDMAHPDEWRTRNNYESMAAMAAAYQRCACYEKIMAIKTETLLVRTCHGDLPLRIYNPGGESGRPVMVFYHGGAFSMNSIEVYEYVHRYLACYGNMIVAAPDYHLAPEYKFPAGLKDAYDALVWTEQNIEAYGGDPCNISVCGDSSGGNFAAAVSMMARDQNGPAVCAQILFFPLTTHIEDGMTDSEKRYKKGCFLEYNCMEQPLSYYFNREEDKKRPLASPLLADDLANLPKACLISAECDPLLDQGLMYAARLEDSGVEVEYHIMEGMVHGFINWTYGKSFDALNAAIRFVNGGRK